jgi:hypothetical protein
MTFSSRRGKHAFFKVAAPERKFNKTAMALAEEWRSRQRALSHCQS